MQKYLEKIFKTKVRIANAIREVPFKTYRVESCQFYGLDEETRAEFISIAMAKSLSFGFYKDDFYVEV